MDGTKSDHVVSKSLDLVFEGIREALGQQAREKSRTLFVELTSWFPGSSEGQNANRNGSRGSTGNWIITHRGYIPAKNLPAFFLHPETDCGKLWLNVISGRGYAKVAQCGGLRENVPIGSDVFSLIDVSVWQAYEVWSSWRKCVSRAMLLGLQSLSPLLALFSLLFGLRHELSACCSNCHSRLLPPYCLFSYRDASSLWQILSPL